MSKRSNRNFGTATVWTKTDTEWTAFMILPVSHAAELAETLRSQGRTARVTF